MGSIEVLFELEGDSEQLCTDIAMDVTAMDPSYEASEDVPSDFIESEKRILTEYTLGSGKPENFST